MPRRSSNVQRFTQAIANANIVTTAETVAFALNGVSTDTPDGQVLLEGEVELLTGATTTGVTVRIRRGTDTTGVLIGAADAEAVGAAVQISTPIQVVDAPGAELASASYVLTVQQTAATGNGTIQQGSLAATF